MTSDRAPLVEGVKPTHTPDMGLPKIDLDALTDAERLQLLDQVWESFRQSPESLPIPESHRREIDARQAEYEAGRMTARPWDEVREETRRRLRRDE